MPTSVLATDSQQDPQQGSQLDSQLQSLAARLRTALTTPLSQTDDLGSPFVGTSPLLLLKTDPAAVMRLAHAKLHSHYPFAEVPTCWRRCFEEACLWSILVLLEHGTLSSATGERSRRCSLQDEVIRLCDDAIIMAGSSYRRELIDEVLSAVDEQRYQPSVVSPSVPKRPGAVPADDETNESAGSDDHSKSLPMTSNHLHRPAKRSRHEYKKATSVPETFPVAPISMRLPGDTTRGSSITDSCKVQHIKAPSLSAFSAHLSGKRPVPIILDDAINYWPALMRWQDPRYWLHRTHNGRRRVPVEWGKSYVDEDWGQSIVPFGEFLRSELLDVATPKRDATVLDADTSRSHPRRKGYLAQHDLLTQIPALRNDIAVPDYCYCSTSEASQGGDDENDDQDEEVTEPLLNVWLGPADTVSPAHTDPHHNLLAQVVGRKYVRLFAPEQSSRLYPMEHSRKEGEGYSMANTSSVDVGLQVRHFPYPGSVERHPAAEQEAKIAAQISLQREQFPDFEKAEYVECVLKPGQMLFIPRGWWHYIRSLEVSCNVSFWWD